MAYDLEQRTLDFSKNILKLQELSALSYFTASDFAHAFKINTASAKVFCSRYKKQGLLVKLKNNY